MWTETTQNIYSIAVSISVSFHLAVTSRVHLAGKPTHHVATAKSPPARSRETCREVETSRPRWSLIDLADLGPASWPISEVKGLDLAASLAIEASEVTSLAARATAAKCLLLHSRFMPDFFSCFSRFFQFLTSKFRAFQQ